MVVSGNPARSCRSPIIVSLVPHLIPRLPAGPGSLLVGAEEDKYENILLCLELLSHLCSKDFFCFDEKPDDTASKLVLIGLDIIVPHIDIGTQACFISL